VVMYPSTPGDFPTFAADFKSRESRARVHARSRALFSLLPLGLSHILRYPEGFSRGAERDRKSAACVVRSAVSLLRLLVALIP